MRYMTYSSRTIGCNAPWESYKVRRAHLHGYGGLPFERPEQRSSPRIELEYALLDREELMSVILDSVITSPIAVLHGLQGSSQAEAWGLLCHLLLRYRALPADSNGAALRVPVITPACEPLPAPTTIRPVTRSFSMTLGRS